MPYRELQCLENVFLTQRLGSLSTPVFETQTATGREHFACQDSGVSQIFILIIPNGEKVLSNVNVVVWRQVIRENSSLSFSVRVSKLPPIKSFIYYIYSNGASTSSFVACSLNNKRVRGRSNHHKIVTISQMFILKWRFRCRCRRCRLSSVISHDELTQIKPEPGLKNFTRRVNNTPFFFHS